MSFGGSYLWNNGMGSHCCGTWAFKYQISKFTLGLWGYLWGILPIQLISTTVNLQASPPLDHSEGTNPSSHSTLGRNWHDKIVEFVVDNAAVVTVLNATFSNDYHLMHLIRLIVLFCSEI